AKFPCSRFGASMAFHWRLPRAFLRGRESIQVATPAAVRQKITNSVNIRPLSSSFRQSSHLSHPPLPRPLSPIGRERGRRGHLSERSERSERSGQQSTVLNRVAQGCNPPCPLRKGHLGPRQ